MTAWRRRRYSRLVVMRSISAIEVRPSRTFCRPSSRRRRMPSRDGHRDHVVDRGALEDQRADRLGDRHHLIDADPAAVAGAARSASSRPARTARRRRGRVRRAPPRRPSGGACSACRACRTSRWATMQSTAEDTRNGSMPMSIRRLERAGGVAGVQRREHEVAGERGLDRDVGGLAVADLADHDHVGVGAQHRAQARRRR